VVDVNATDQDTGDYGEVRYQLEDNPNNAFTIDPLTVGTNITAGHYSLPLPLAIYLICDDGILSCDL